MKSDKSWEDISLETKNKFISQARGLIERGYITYDIKEETLAEKIYYSKKDINS